MEQRGVVIVMVDDVFDGFVAELVRRPVHVAALDTAAGQPNRKAVGVMIGPMFFSF